MEYPFFLWIRLDMGTFPPFCWTKFHDCPLLTDWGFSMIFWLQTTFITQEVPWFFGCFSCRAWRSDVPCAKGLDMEKRWGNDNWWKWKTYNSPNSVATLRGSYGNSWGPVFNRGGLGSVRHFPCKFLHKMLLSDMSMCISTVQARTKCLLRDMGPAFSL